MNERRKRIEELAARYFEARTTDAEERELRELARVGDSGMAEELRVLFGGLDALAGERMPVERETAVGWLSWGAGLRVWPVRATWPRWVTK